MLLVVAGPSGAGKSSLIGGLRASELATKVIAFPVYTTRPPRIGDALDGNKRLIDDEQFDLLIANGDFAEVVKFDSYRYGIRRSDLKAARRSGIWVLEYPGDYPQPTVVTAEADVRILLIPPSVEILVNRLQDTGRDGRVIEAVEEYQECVGIIASQETEAWGWHVVLSTEFNQTTNEVLALLQNGRP